MARATNFYGLTATSGTVQVSVTENGGGGGGGSTVIGIAPTITVTSPTVGSVIAVNAGVPLSASAADADGNVTSVQFFVNGTSVGTDSTPPYTATWSPTSFGDYVITARVTDDSGNIVSSTDTVVSVSAAATLVYTGIISGPQLENGTFALVTVDGRKVVFMGSTTDLNGVKRSYYFDDVTLESNGTFSKQSGGSTVIAGNLTTLSATGTIGASDRVFIGATPIVADSPYGGVGLYEGSIVDRPDSLVQAIIAADRTIFVRVAEGSVSDVGQGTLASSAGAFSLTTNAGHAISGQVDVATRFLSATITGALSGSVRGGLVTGGTFSDGALRGLSTRGFIGTGDNIMIAGFFVDGSVPKSIILRGIGPSMAALGVPGTLANPAIVVRNSADTIVASNDNWTNNAGTLAALAAVGLQPPVSSLESVVQATLAPGAYTAQLSGSGGGTGEGLVEVYDADGVASFPVEKVSAISTRGLVSSGGSMIAGFYVNGVAPKRVLVQAVGPTLAGVGVSGFLADPVLQLVRINADGSQTVVRVNDNWERGNDVVMLRDSAAAAGATPLQSGGRDSAILITLPPGTYTAVVTGAGTSSGIALVNVYEAP